MAIGPACEWAEQNPIPENCLLRATGTPEVVNRLSSMTDTPLWQRWQDERSADAFAELVQRHSTLIYATSRRVLGNNADAEDVTQECFLEVLRGKVEIREPAAPLLHTLAVRRALDHRRRESRRRAREVAAASRPSAEARVADDGEALQLLDEILLALPESVRSPLIQRYFDGSTHQDIAGRLGVAESTIRHRLQRGIEELRRRLGQRGVTVSAGALAASLGAAAEAAPGAAFVMRLVGLARSGSACAAATTTSATPLAVGLMTTKKLVLAAGIAAALVGALLWQMRSPRDDSVPDTVGLDAVAADPTADAESATTAPSFVATSSGPDGAGAGETESAAAVSFIGVVRDAERDRPLAGVTVELGGVASQSSDDGRFEIQGARAGSDSLTLSLDGYVTSVASVPSDAEGGAPADGDSDEDPSNVGASNVPAPVFLLSPALVVRITDREGRAVEGAQVVVADSLQSGADFSAPQRRFLGPRSTDAEGLARFPTIARRPTEASNVHRNVYAVIKGPAVACGIASEYLSDNNGERSPPEIKGPLELTLAPSLRVQGVVRVPEGEDVTQVTVFVRNAYVRDPSSPLGAMLSRFYPDERRLWPEEFEAHPAPDGSFQLAYVPRGAHVRVSADAPGLGRVLFSSESPQELQAIDLDLAPAGAIEGQLVFRANGALASGFRLVAQVEDHFGHAPFAAVTDDNGRFRFEGLPANSYSIGQNTRGEPPDGLVPVASGVQVRSGGTVRDLRLFVEDGIVVGGTISNAGTGEVVANVMVSATQGSRGHERFVGTAVTDEGGRYTLRLPSGTTSFYLSSIPAGFRRRPEPQRHRIRLVYGEPGRTDVDFALAPGEEPMPAFLRAHTKELGHVLGKVVGEDGEPLADISIQAHRQWHTEEGAKGPWVNPTHRTHTEPDGTFRVPVSADKDYKILASGAEFDSVWSEVVRVERDAEKAVASLTLRRGSLELRGLVVDSEGRPLESVAVHASSKSKRGNSNVHEPRTDVQGRFHLRHLLRGETVTLRFTRAGFEPRDLRLLPGRRDVRVTLYSVRDGVARHSKRASKPEKLVGKDAPPWSLEWVRKVPPPARPDRGDGKATVVLITQFPSDWEAFEKVLVDLGPILERRDAVGLVVFDPSTHRSLFSSRVDGIHARIGFAIDQFSENSEVYPPGVTIQAYGFSFGLPVMVIDAGGKVVAARYHIQSASEIDSLLGE